MAKINSFFKYKDIFHSSYFLTFLALLSGIMAGTSYIPYPPWAILFCYIPLWYATLKATQIQRSYKFIFLLGWITQFTLTLIGFNWIYFTAREFGNLPQFISLLALVLFAAFIHLYIPAAITLASYLKKRFDLSLSAFIFTLAFIHILIERIWPSIFEWNFGYTLLWIKSPFAQWADTVGFWGLSALIFLLQAVLFYILIAYQTQKKKCLSLFFLALTFLATSWLIGRHKQEHYRSNTNAEISVIMTQANISNEEKLQAEKGFSYRDYVLNAYFEETNTELNASGKPDFIIWPETALPLALDKEYHSNKYQSQILNQIRNWDTNLITGAYSSDLIKKDHLGNSMIRNAVFFLNSQGEFEPPYFKTDLLVFGEYMPFGQEFPILYKLLPFVGVYEKGPGPVSKKLITLQNTSVLLGPQICYESLNPGFSRQLAKLNNQIFFNLTNDSWFGDWAEPYQHMIMTLARGLENRRPLIRSTNTGISTTILASGDILEQSPIYKKWVHTYKIKYNTQPDLTFYARIGYLDWMIWLSLLLIVLWKGQNVSHQKS